MRRGTDKQRPAPIRRLRRQTIGLALVMLGLLALAIGLIVDRMTAEPPLQIREDRLLTLPVHIFTVDGLAAEDVTASPAPDDAQGQAPASGLYPVPLAAELQAHIARLCNERGVDPALVYAVIAVETGGTWDPALVGDGGTSFGLMQIHECDHRDRMERLRVFNLYDPYQNVDVGIDLLSELLAEDKPLSWVLMAYNGGPGNADAWTADGTLTVYARRGLCLAEIYREAVDG